MRKEILTVLPYGILILICLFLAIIWWPSGGGWAELTNSWVGLFFICSFCAIFLFQEDIYHYLDQHINRYLFGSAGPLQKNREIPEIFKDEQKFQELISGTVMAWMEKISIEKEEEKLREEAIANTIERFKKAKKDSIKWLFLFANHFLVQHSKDILFEIYERHYVTREIFGELAGEIGIDEKESEAILEILQYLKFIRKQDEEIIITETGSAYCTYLERTNQK